MYAQTVSTMIEHYNFYSLGYSFTWFVLAGLDAAQQRT